MKFHGPNFKLSLFSFNSFTKSYKTQTLHLNVQTRLLTIKPLEHPSFNEWIQTLPKQPRANAVYLSSPYRRTFPRANLTWPKFGFEFDVFTKHRQHKTAFVMKVKSNFATPTLKKMPAFLSSLRPFGTVVWTFGSKTIIYSLYMLVYVVTFSSTHVNQNFGILLSFALPLLQVSCGCYPSLPF